MIGASPDCHTYYVDKAGGVHRSRPEPASGQTARIPTTGTALGGPDEAGLTGRILPGGIVYMTFNNFAVTANYKIFDEIRKMMDKGLAAGGKAWLFDFRGNVGGDSTPTDRLVLPERREDAEDPLPGAAPRATSAARSGGSPTRTSCRWSSS